MTGGHRHRIAVALAALILSAALEAAPIRVRLLEGNFRGFLVLRTLDGQALAYGDVSQSPKGGLVKCRMLLRFKDGSLYDETTTFSQKRFFRLERYRLLQKGPSFPTNEISFDRQSGEYLARIQDRVGGKLKEASGKFDMPADVYNGMSLTLLKNLPEDSDLTAGMAVFLPQPKVIEMKWITEGEDKAFLGGRSLKATRTLVKLKIGGLTGVIAGLIGKSPPELRYWLITGDIPAFAKFEGAMFLGGPVWRMEMSAVAWPKEADEPPGGKAGKAGAKKKILFKIGK